MKIDNLYSKYINMGLSSKITLAKKALSYLWDELKKKDYTEKECAEIVKKIVCYFVNVDNVLSEEEYNLFIEIFNSKVSKEVFDKIILSNKQDDIEEINKIIDSLSSEGKSSALALSLIIISSDQELNDIEKRAFEKLMI